MAAVTKSPACILVRDAGIPHLQLRADDRATLLTGDKWTAAFSGMTNTGCIVGHAGDPTSRQVTAGTMNGASIDLVSQQTTNTPPADWRFHHNTPTIASPITTSHYTGGVCGGAVQFTSTALYAVLLCLGVSYVSPSEEAGFELIVGQGLSNLQFVSPIFHARFTMRQLLNNTITLNNLITVPGNYTGAAAIAGGMTGFTHYYGGQVVLTWVRIPP